MELVLHNFRGHSSLYRSFSEGFTRLNGKVATGKTTLLDSIKWVLYGGADYAPHIWTPCPLHDRITELGKFPSKATIVLFSISLNGTFNILRQANPAALYCWQDDQIFANALRDGVAQSIIEARFGSELLWQACSYSIQGEYHPLLIGSNATRKKIIDQMMSHRYQGGITPEQILTKINGEISQLNSRLVVLDTQIGVLTHQWNQMRLNNPQLAAIYDQIVSEDIVITETQQEIQRMEADIEQGERSASLIKELNVKLGLINRQRLSKSQRLEQIKAQYRDYDPVNQLNQINLKKQERELLLNRLDQGKQQLNQLEQSWQQQQQRFLFEQAQYYAQQKTNQTMMETYERENARINQQNQQVQQQYQQALQRYSLEGSLRSRYQAVKEQIEQTKLSPHFTLDLSMIGLERYLSQYTLSTLKQSWDRWNHYRLLTSKLPDRWSKRLVEGQASSQQVDKRIASLQLKTNTVYKTLFWLASQIRLMTNTDLPGIKQTIEQNRVLLTQLEQQIIMAQCILVCPSCQSQLKLKDQKELVKSEQSINVREVELSIETIKQQQTMLIQYRDTMDQYVQLSTQLTGSIQPLEYWKPFNQEMVHELNLLLQLKDSYTVIPAITLDQFESLVAHLTIKQSMGTMEVELQQLETKMGTKTESPNPPELLSLAQRPVLVNLTFPVVPNDSQLKQLRAELSHIQASIEMINSSINSIEQIMIKYPKELIAELQTGIVEDQVNITALQDQIDSIDISFLDGLKERRKQLLAYLELLKLIPAWRNHNNEISLLTIQAGALREEAVTAQELKQLTVESENISLQNSVTTFNTILSNYLIELFDRAITVELSLFKEIKNGETRPVVNFQIQYNGKEITGFKTFSGGESNQLSLAITLAMSNICGTGILLLDEITAYLDSAKRERSTELIKESGLANYIIMVDHEGLEAHYSKQTNIE